MWGYAIFCEYPGCQKFEAVSAEGDIPLGWLSVDQGVELPDLSPENLGTFCGWAHTLETLQKMAPDADARVDISGTRLRGRPVETVGGPLGGEESGHA